MNRDNVLTALKNLRNDLRNSMTEKEREEADELEIKNGTETLVKKLNKMETASLCLIADSLIEKNPKILTDVADYIDIIEKMHDVFGVDLTSKMFSGAMKEIKGIVEIRLNKEKSCENKLAENGIESLLKEMNGDLEEPKEERAEKMPEEIKELLDFLKNKDIEYSVVELND